jgi:hypothetical protein
LALFLFSIRKSQTITTFAFFIRTRKGREGKERRGEDERRRGEKEKVWEGEEGK